MFIKNKQSGFTLVEVIMSMAVFSIGALMILASISLSVKYMQISTTRQKAVSLAKELIDSKLSESETEEKIQEIDGFIFFDEKNNLNISIKAELLNEEYIKVKKDKANSYSIKINSTNYIKVYELKATVYTEEGDKIAEICRFKTANPKDECIKIP